MIDAAKERGIPDRSLAAIAALAIIYVAAYMPALNGAFIWDDDYFISENPTLRSLSGLWQIWTEPAVRLQYYPLVHTSFWIENHLWGLNPTGYHVVNLALHALNAFLFWRVLRRLDLPAAWFAAAIFLMHPVCVESVAWMTERKNVLSMAFYLLAALAWLRFDPLRTEEPEKGAGEAKWWAASFFLYIAALLSKSVTCSLPAVLLLLIWWRRGSVSKKDVLRLLPFFIVGLGLGLLTAWMERAYVGAQGEEFSLAPSEKVLVAGHALWFYAGKLVWPHPLAFIYPRWKIDPADAGQWLFPAAVLAVIASLFLLRRRIGRGPLVAVLCFCGTLLPAIGFFNVYPHRFSFVADHFQYLACLFLIALLATGVVQMLRSPAVRLGAATLIVAACACAVWVQAHVYQSREALWTDTIDKNPECWLAHFNYGNLLQKRGEIDGAIGHYREAVKYYPRYADAISNLGGALEIRGELKEAEALHEQALALRPSDPRMHYNLGVLLGNQGRADEAIAHFKDALQLNDDFAEAHANLGNQYASQGRLDDAIEHYRRAMSLQPDNAKTANNLGTVYAQQGKLNEAVQCFQQAVSVDPLYVDAIINWGLALNMAGQRDAANERFRKALNIDPANAVANFRLAESAAASGDAADAKHLYECALQTRPDWPDALARLAWLLATTPEPNVRNPDEAVSLSQKALEAGGQRPWLLDVRAAALAAAGQYNEALKAIDLAIAGAKQQQQNDFAAVLESRKQLYSAGQTYKEVPRQSKP